MILLVELAQQGIRYFVQNGEKVVKTVVSEVWTRCWYYNFVMYSFTVVVVTDVVHSQTNPVINEFPVDERTRSSSITPNLGYLKGRKFRG